MKTRNTIWVLFAILVLLAGNVQAVVTTTPASITVAADRPSSHTITWNLTVGSPVPSATAVRGVFQSVGGGVDLGVINLALTGYFPGATMSDTVGETFTIPLSVLKKAEQLGYRTIRYYRDFGGASVGNGYMTIYLTSPGAAPLNINHIQLYFANNRAEITVKRKEPGLKTFADINFTGKGLLKGYWQVDDRIISYVNKNLVYGTSLTIATPDMPSLPTFSEGTHVVKFIIQSPDQGIQSIEFPKALYYVTPSETTETVMINLLNPFNLAMLERKDPVFQWQTFKPLALFLVEFMETENGEPIFAAYTIESRYVVPHAALRNYLRSPQPYYWRVTGFDKENNIAGESEVRQVRFKTE